MATCPFCKARLANSVFGYSAHIERFHKDKSVQSVLPMNTTGRSKAQIVSEWEALNYKHLIDGRDKTHPTTCICNTCFQKKLDALVDSSARSAQETQELMEGLQS